MVVAPKLSPRCALHERGGGSLQIAEAHVQPWGLAAAAISNRLVQLHKEYYGRGPTKAKTYLVDDTVICILQGGFTVVERTLIDNGKAEAVRDIRREFQSSMEGRFKQVIKEATGREVVAYMSQIHSDPDIAVELFVLEPGHEPVREEHEADLA
jgi:uncharacterized protein YbcI